MSISGFPSGLAFSAGNNMFSDMDAQMALANSVTGNETPEQLAQIQAKDKQLSLNKVKNDVNYQYANAWQEQLDERAKKRQEHTQRLMDMGSIFVPMGSLFG